MSIRESYSFVEREGANFTGVKLVGGKYDGTIYHYRYCSVEPLENDQAKLNFNYNILENPKNLQNSDFNEEFVNLLGDILADILLRTFEEQKDFLLTENIETKKQRIEQI